MIGLSNGRDAGFGRRAGPARQAVQWWTSPSGRRTRVRGPVENDASMEIRKQRGFPQAPRLRRISHRPDGGNASPSTCFQAAAIHLQIGNLLSEEWGHPQGLSLYSILATAKIGPLQQAPTGTKAHHQAPLSRLMFLLENAVFKFPFSMAGSLLLIMSCLGKESLWVSANHRERLLEICSVSRTRSSIRF